MNIKKISLLLLTALFVASSCTVEHGRENTIVGVWKPSVLILPENIKKNEKQAQMVFVTFDQSRDMLYHFHADSTFTLESSTDGKGFQDAEGTYSLNGNAIAIKIYNTVLTSDIIKISEKEMKVMSPDSVIIIYERFGKK